MRTLLFIGIVLVSGTAAGLVHGTVNTVLAGPYLDAAIEIENRHLSGIGAENDEFWDAQHQYRTWQQGGQLLAGAVLGAGMGSLFGIVFALSRRTLPGAHNVGKAAILAGIMWLVVFFIPFLKYPASLPGVGDPGTIEIRTALYVTFVVISGFGAAGCYGIGRGLAGGKRPAAAAVAAGCGYAALMAAAFVMMPANPDGAASPEIPADLADGFRTASVLGVTSFWAAVPLILGALWQRFEPDADAGPGR